MQKILLFLAALSLFTGMSTVRAQIFNDLSIDVQSVTVDSMTGDELALQVQLKIFNPNKTELNANAMSYKFSLELQPIASGQINRKISLPAQKTTLVQFPVILRPDEITEKLEKLANKDTLIYGLSGEITPSGLFSVFTIPYETAGYIPNLRQPNIELTDVQATEVSFVSVELAIKLSIDNINSFAFVVDKLEYELAINGKRLKEETVQNPLTAAAKSKTVLTLPISLEPLTALDIVDEALSGEAVNVLLQGWAEVETPLGTIRLPIRVEDRIRIAK